MTAMSHGTSVLSLKYIFGLNADCLQDIELFDSKTMFYSAGAFLVKYNLEDKSQDFSQNFRQFISIDAICLSPLRNFVAIARSGEKVQVHLLETHHIRKKKSTMPLTDDLAKEINKISYISFSANEERMATLGLGKDPHILMWAIDPHQTNIKLMAHISLSGYNCLELKVNPNNHAMVSVIGPDNFKILKLYDDTLKISVSNILARKECSTDYNCHTWLGPRNSGLIVCTKAKQIYVLKDNADIIDIIEDEEGTSVLCEPACVVAITDGFIVGGDNLKIQVFLKDESGYFRLTSTYRIGQNSIGGYLSTELKELTVRNIKIDPEDERRLVCITDSRTIYTAVLRREKDDKDKDDFDPTTENGSPVFTLVTDPGHNGKISFVDTCIRKPYVVTCSPDKTVKIWDYEKKELVYNMNFPEEIFAVAFHPSGFHIVVALADKVQVINLYLNTKDHHRKDFREIAVKGCKFVKFSNGGHLIALAADAPPQKIFVYKFYSYNANPIHIFKGHTGNIKCLEWSEDDLSIFSSGTHGMIYKWNIRDGHRKEIIQKKGNPMNDMCLSYESNPGQNSTAYSILCAMEDTFSLQEVNNQSIIKTESGPIFGCVVKTKEKKMIFAGVKDTDKAGSICFFRHPLSNQFTDSFFAHNQLGINKLALTPKDRYLISCGFDGTLMVFEVEDKDSKGGSNVSVEFKEHCQNILVTQQEIQDLTSNRAALSIQLSDEQGQGSNNIDVGSSLSENIKMLNDYDKLKLEHQREYEKLKKEHAETEALKQRELESELAECSSAKKELEVYFTDQFGDEQDMIKDVEKQIQDNELKYMRLLEQQKKNHEDHMFKIEAEFRDELNNENDAKKRLMKDIDDLRLDHERIIREIKNEAETEEKDLELKYKDEVDSLKNKLIKLKNDTQSNQKKLAKNNQLIEQLEQQFVQEEKRQGQLEKNLTQLETDMKDLERKLEDKNRKVQEKEREIYELKKRTGELEKFKYVLDFKIKELKKDILPREKEIERLKTLTTEKDTLLKKLNGMNNNLGIVVEHLEKQQVDLVAKIEKNKKKLIGHSAEIKNFKMELYNAIQLIQNYGALVEALKKMNKKPKNIVEVDSGIIGEYKNQVKYLAVTAKNLKANLERDAEMHKKDNMRIMEINVKLIKRMNQMRNKLKDLNQSSKPENYAKIGGINDEQEEKEKRMAELKKKRVEHLNDIQKLEEDLVQLQKSYRLN
jgi:WD40 repeat protein